MVVGGSGRKVYEVVNFFFFGSSDVKAYHVTAYIRWTNIFYTIISYIGTINCLVYSDYTAFCATNRMRLFALGTYSIRSRIEWVHPYLWRDPRLPSDFVS